MDEKKRLTDTSPMPFGKHRGTAMANVPADYLLWLRDNDKCNPAVAEYIRLNFDAIAAEQKQQRKEYFDARMPFGEYKGWLITDVAHEYLLACYESGKCPKNVKAYVEANMERLQGEAEKSANSRALLRTMCR